MSDASPEPTDAVSAAHAMRDHEEQDRLRQLGGLLVHDLNNVLFALLGRLQLLERRAETDATRKAAREILETARMIEKQVVLLHAACRRDEPAIDCSDARIALRNALRTCAAALPSSIRPPEIDRCVDGIPEGATFEGDPMQVFAAVAQVMSIHRARARTPLAVSISVSRGDSPRLELLIEDHAGKPDALPEMPSLLGGNFALSGIPLAAARRSIRDFGGRVECEASDAGLRTRLSFELSYSTPVARFDASGGALPARGALPAQGGGDSCDHADEGAPPARRVLIADDDPAVRAVLVAALEAVGDDVDTLDDPGSCDAHAELDRFDVVILDAGGGGLEALARLRARGVEVPVLVASGDDVERPGDRLTRCVMKPLALESLDRELTALARLRTG